MMLKLFAKAINGILLLVFFCLLPLIALVLLVGIPLGFRSEANA